MNNSVPCCKGHSRKQRKNDIAISRNEEFWIEVIRQASGDADPPPRLDVVRRIRAIFRDALLK